MSYVFDNINNQLDDTNKKTDIFGQAGTPSSGQNSALGTDALTKTDTSSDLGSAGQAQGSQRRDAISAQTPEDRQRILNVQAGRQGAPKITEKISGDLDKAKADLQNEANQYTKGYQEKDYREGVTKDVLGKAVSGDQEAFNQSYGRILKNAYGNVDQFKPKTETELQAVKDLETTGGIKQMFKREQGPQYSSADAAFDTMLLTRNPEFRKIQTELARKQVGLRDERALEEKQRTEAAQKLADEGFQSASKGLREDLGGFRQNIENPLKQREAEEEAKRAQLDQASLARDYEARMAAKLREEFSRGGDSFFQRAARGGQFGGIDANPFVDIARDVDWRQFAKEDEASQYNRIMQLLNEKDRLEAGPGPGEAVKYNEAAIRDALINEARGERETVEQKYRDEMNRLLAARDQEAQQSAGLRGRDVGSFYNDAFSEIRSGLENTLRNNINDYYANLGGSNYAAGSASAEMQERNRRDALNQALSQVPNFLRADAVDPSKFYKKAQALSGADYLRESDAQRLRELAAETGDTRSFNAAYGTKQMQDEFDRQAYQNALREYYSNFGKAGSGGSDEGGWLGKMRRQTGW